MRFRIIPVCGLVSALAFGAPPSPDPVLGVVSSRAVFMLGQVETKPEAGPLPVVSGDEVSAGKAPVLVRLKGQNRVTLGGTSRAQIRPILDEGRYFYLQRGSIQFDALKEPIAICAAGRLYLPSIPSSGEVSIADGKRITVRMTSGTMQREGKDACTSKGPPSFLLAGAGATAGAAGAASATAGAATAGAAGAAAAAGAGATISSGTLAAAAGVATAAATTATAVVAASGAEVPPPPPSSSVILPN